MRELIKYHNDFERSLMLKDLTANELNILIAICSQMNDLGTQEVVFDFSSIKEIVGWKRKNNQIFFENLLSMNDKLQNLRFKLHNGDETVQFVLFPTFKTNKRTQKLTIEVHKDFAYLLNNLTNNFTQYEVKIFTNLKSKYSKLFFRAAIRFKDTGKFYISIEEFRKKLDIPPSYRMSHIDKKVLEVIKQELKDVFIDLEVEKVKAGREIVQLNFTFIPFYTDNNKHATLHVIEESDENLAPEEQLDQFFKATFPQIKYYKETKEILHKLLKKNSLTYVKNYLIGNYNYALEQRNVRDKTGLFIHIIQNNLNYMPVPEIQKEEAKEETQKITEKQQEKEQIIEPKEIEEKTEDNNKYLFIIEKMRNENEGIKSFLTTFKELLDTKDLERVARDLFKVYYTDRGVTDTFEEYFK